MKTVLLSDNWEFLTPNDTWLSAQVPGHVHLDLIRHDLIQDPFVRQQEKDCQWVDERDWSYRCRFDWQPDVANCNRVLRFEGLDTVCSVFLNGEKVAEHDNMFMPVEIDVSDRLRPGENEIFVEFESAARVGRDRKAAYFASQGLADDTPNFDERAFVRKAQYMFGWDWGPRLVSCGIWKPVRLVEGSSDELLASYKPSAKPTSRLVHTPDQWGESFEFELNGRPMFALGANWIPDHSFPNKLPPRSRGKHREAGMGAYADKEYAGRVKDRLTTAKQLGVNMLRVWGGGIYECDEFYELCEELGILVWQDFMFACSYYPDTPEWQDEIRKEAEHQVLRLRHHPCIALWCGNNECHQVWEDGWGGKDKQPSRFHGEALYHEVLADVVRRLDPERPYWPGSPFGGEYCNQGGVGDQHYWEVWHGKGDWVYYNDSTARFCSEFGFMSSPSRATWERAGISKSVPVEDPDARWHNKTGKPFNVIRSLVELHYPLAKDLEEWSYYTQLNQRDAMRAAIEHFRFSEFCRGALIWQLNDCWPVESWSLLEFDGRKKAAAYELKRLFAPLLLRIRLEGEEAILEGCLHNSDSPREGHATLEAFDLRTGQSLARQSTNASIQPDESSELLRFAHDADKPSIVRGTFAGATATVVTARPTGITHRLALKAEVNGLEVTLTAEEPCVDVYIEDTADAQTEFEPNFFTLLPGEARTVRASRPVGDPSLRASTFNR